MIYHLLQSHDAPRTGVPRFSRCLQAALPGIVNVTPDTLPKSFDRKDIVVTDNHLSLSVPQATKTVVVHHGSAETHWSVDPSWRCEQTLKMTNDQREMMNPSRMIRRWYVAPSRWIRDQFCRWHPWLEAEYATLIVHHVPVISRKNVKRDRPVVIGDWRNWNKGSDHWKRIAALLPEYDFQQLSFDDDAARVAAYANADVYLCLSLSEGSPYSVADAEAACLRIVSTWVGNAYEFLPFEIDDRDDVGAVADKVRRAVAAGPRCDTSFFHDWTFDRWARAWRELIEQVNQW